MNVVEGCNKARGEVYRSYNECFVEQQKVVWPHFSKVSCCCVCDKLLNLNKMMYVPLTNDNKVTDK